MLHPEFIYYRYLQGLEAGDPPKFAARVAVLTTYGSYE